MDTLKSILDSFSYSLQSVMILSLRKGGSALAVCNLFIDKRRQVAKGTKVTFMRRAFAIAASIGFICSVSACGQSTQTSADGEHLTIAWWGSQDRNNKQAQVDKLFEKENPGVKIDGQFSQYSDYWQKLATGAAGDQMPDIIAMDSPYFSQYADNDLLVDLQPYVNTGTLDLSEVSKATVDAGRSEEGNLYAISGGSNAPALMYDKTLLDSLGITIPKNWTWDDFIDICREVYEASGVKTNAGYYRDVFVLQYLLRGDGKELFKNGQLNVTDESQIEPYFVMFQKGIDEGWHLDPTVFTEISLSAINQDPLIAYSDAAHRSWCNFGWSNSLPSLQSLVTNGDKLALTTWPSANIKKSNYVHPSMYWAITKNCKNPELAARWIDFYVNNAQANKIMGTDRGVPINNKMYAVIKEGLGESDLTAIEYLRKVVEPNSSTISAPMPEKSSQINSSIMPSIQEEILYKRLDAKQAAEKFISQASAALNR